MHILIHTLALSHRLTHFVNVQGHSLPAECEHITGSAGQSAGYTVRRRRNPQKDHLAFCGWCRSSASQTVKSNAFTYSPSTGKSYFLCIHCTDDSCSSFLFTYFSTLGRGSRISAERERVRETSQSGSGLTSSMSLLNDAYCGNTKRQMNRYFSTSRASHYIYIHHPQSIHKVTLTSEAHNKHTLAGKKLKNVI